MSATKKRRTTPNKQITKTETSIDVRKTCQRMGDSLSDQYHKNKDIKAAQTAIQAYSIAIKVACAQLVYKKLTTSPGRISFFEDGDSNVIQINDAA